MTVLLAFQTGLDCLRMARNARLCLNAMSAVKAPALLAPTDEQIEQISRLATCSPPLHVAVSSPSYRRRKHGLQTSVCRGPLTARSVFSIAPGIWCPTPELVFLQAHEYLSDIECIALGYELCGTYCRKGTDAIVYKIPPATSAKAIARYLSRSAGARHIKRARRNATRILDRAASPREAQMAMLFTLPHRIGGYGLPSPQLNRPISGSGGRKLQLNEIRYVDMCWPSAKVAVEYDSDEFHTGADKISHDAARRTLLQSHGYRVVVVTNRQIKSSAECDRVALTLHKLLGKRNRTTIKGFGVKNANLRRDLMQLEI